MRPLRLIIILLCLSPCSLLNAQVKRAKPAVAPKTADLYAAIDQKALQMPDSATRSTDGMAAYINAGFNGSREKARAAFIWIATNIQYDLANMFAIDFYEKLEEKIAKPLKTRKGICENYAALFNDICSKTGIRSFVVEGYTKQNGFKDYIPHAWCAAYIDTAWFLFDPTWGSGYVSNSEFHPRINNDYFMASPAVLIKSHMPFDYLWQFLYYPISSLEFYQGKTQQNTTKPWFNYPDSIAAFEKLGKIESYAAAADRIERNGLINAMVFDRLRHLRTEIEAEKQRTATGLFNAAVTDFNNAARYYNEFIDYRNKQFRPEKPDSAIQAMADTPAGYTKAATAKLDQIKAPTASITSLMEPIRKQIADLDARIEEQQTWLKKYFSKGKLLRKMMFTQH